MIQDEMDEKFSMIYDYIQTNYIEWPYTGCKFGDVLQKYDSYTSQQIVMSCRTDASYNPTNRSWNKLGSFLVVANFDYPNNGYHLIDKYEDFFTINIEAKRSSFLKPMHIFVHEGEIYRVEVCKVDKRWIATSSDTNNICLWDIVKQKSNVHYFRYLDRYSANKCDLLLYGLGEKALYALRWSPNNYSLIAGGEKGKVAIWELEEHNQKLTKVNSGSSTFGYISDSNSTMPKLSPSTLFKAHERTVEDVSFCPSNQKIVITCSEDSSIKIWDTRALSTSTSLSNLSKPKLTFNCKNEIYSLDWSNLDDNYILVGCNDGYYGLIDQRKSDQPIREVLHCEGTSIRKVQFSDFSKEIFALGGDHLYLMEGVTQDKATTKFVHTGHNSAIIDFDFNPSQKWGMVSASENPENEYSGGGILQVFKPLDLLCMDDEEAERKIAEVMEEEAAGDHRIS